MARHNSLPFGFRVPPDEHAVCGARRRLAEIARAWALLDEAALRDLELCAAEVLANAYRHTRAPCVVVMRWTGHRVRVEVTDTSPVMPALVAAPDDADHGRGLAILEAVAAAWGAHPDPAGKVVWFEIRPPTAPPRPGRQLDARQHRQLSDLVGEPESTTPSAAGQASGRRTPIRGATPPGVRSLVRGMDQVDGVAADEVVLVFGPVAALEQVVGA